MSVILDALKKAQNDRVKTEVKIPLGNGGPAKGGSRRLVYIAVAGVLCIALVFLFMPSRKAPITPAANVNAPVKVAPPTPVVSAPPPPQVKAEAPLKAAAETPPEVVTTRNRPAATRPLKPSAGKPPVEASTASAAAAKEPGGGPSVSVPARTASPEVPARTGIAAKRGPAETHPPQADSRPRAPVAADARVVVERSDEGRITSLYNSAAKAADQGHMAEARRAYQAILSEKPGYVEALNNLGVLFLKEGNTREAASYFRKSLEYRKDYGKAYNNMGLAMMQEGQKDLAAEYFRKAAELEPGGIEPALNLSALLRGQGRQAEASAVLKSLIDRGVGNSMVFLSYAVVSDEMGAAGEAVRYYRHFLRDGGSGQQRAKVLERLKILEERQGD